MIIYKATLPNKKCYIGQTTSDLSVRKRNHRYKAMTKNSNILFHNAIRKYGFENIQWEVIEQCDSWESLQARETELIIENNALFPNGYNLTLGGRQPKMSDKTRLKMSLSAKGKKKPPMSEETRKKISLALKGKPNIKLRGQKNHLGHKGARWKLSDETKKKMSESAKNSGTGKWMTGVWIIRKNNKINND